MRGALLDTGQLRQQLLVGGVPVGDEESGEESQDGGDRGGTPRPQHPQPGQRPAGRADHRHVRGPAVRLAGVRVFIGGEHADRGLVRAERRLGGQRGSHRVIEPGLLQPDVQPAGGLIHEPGGHRHAEQHADQVRGPLGGHVPVPGQQHRGGIDARPVADAARARAGRGVRGAHLPAAPAGQRGKQPFGDEPADAHVPDLRPRRTRGLRARQPGPAPRALRRRLRGLPLVRVRVPGKASPGMARLPAPLAVLAALPLRRIPPLPLRLAALLRPDALLRRRRPGVSAVLPEPTFQLRDPQLQPAAQLPLGRQLRAQHRVLGVLGLDHSPQPGQQLTLLPGTSRQIRRIGHKPRSCSSARR